MEKNKLKQIHDFGQSIWLDFIDRRIMDSGDLSKLIDEDGLRGITSNPAIFKKAISSSSDYDADIEKLARSHKSSEDIFYELAVSDIQRAADFFKSVYEEEVKGADGYVSLEVSPRLALNSQGTIQQALELWRMVDRPNVMIKIPGTAEGLPAIRKCISEGLNINVTLLFGLERYEAVAEAYIAGLEDRVEAGKSIGLIASVASFFLSRIDVMVDPMLEEKGMDQLKGEVAIASAKKAYQIYKRVFNSERFKKLETKGAKPQRLLWASTSTKNPDYLDTKYVEPLIGPNTVNTLPMETLEAFRDHGQAENRLEQDVNKAGKVLDQLKENGIDLKAVSQKLEEEGIDKFNQPYDQLLDAIESKKRKVLS